LILAGDSAGGNLTLSLLYVIRQVRLEKERSELQKHRERRLSLSASGGGFTTRSVDNQQHQQQREWEKGPVERWIEKEREREEVVPSEAVEKVLQTRRQQKSKEGGDSGDDDAVEADKTSEQRWPASDMTESQHRAWERRTLASDDKFMSKHQLPFELADGERDVFPPMPLAAVLLSPWVDLRFVPRRPIVHPLLCSLTRHDTHTTNDTTQ
jgi:hypothetical protein